MENTKGRKNIIVYNKFNNRTEKNQSLNKLFVITRLSSKVSKDLIPL
jgi:hypothetical protein